MATEILAGWVATSHRMEKYGGVAVAHEALERMAEDLRDKQIPVQLDHDALMKVEAEVLVAAVREMPEGGRGVWVEIKVPEGTSEGRTGFSFAATMTTYSAGVAGGAPVALFVDDEEIDGDLLRQAADELAAHGYRVAAGPYLQFSVGSELAAIVVRVGAEVLPGLIAAGLYDVIKKLWRRGPRTEVRLEIEGPGDQKATALLRSRDPEVAREALEQLAELAVLAPLLVWGEGGWAPPQADGCRDLSESEG